MLQISYVQEIKNFIKNYYVDKHLYFIKKQYFHYFYVKKLYQNLHNSMMFLFMIQLNFHMIKNLFDLQIIWI